MSDLPVRLDLEATLEGDELVLRDSEGGEQRVPPAPDWWPTTYADWAVAYVANDGLELPGWAEAEFRRMLEGVGAPEPRGDSAAGSAFLQALYGIDEPELLKLFAQVDAYLTLDDIDSLLATLATAVSVADTDGEPLWLMLVGPASGSKTETIRMLVHAADRQLSDLTLAGLLSGRPPKDGEVQASGVLVDLGDDCNAFVTISDMSSLLARNGGAMSGQVQSGVFEALRDIYDGAYSRTMDRASPSWRGRVTLLAAVTPAIDSFAGHSDSLGPRWVYFRLRQLSDVRRKMVTELVASRKDVGLHRAAVATEVKRIVDAARERVVDLAPDVETLDVVGDCAMLASYGRAVVPRDYRGQIVDVPYWEEPGRLAQQLKKLSRALEALGVDPATTQRVVRRAALSCVPASRAKALRQLADGEWHSTNEVARGSNVRHVVAQHALDAWEVTGVAELRIINYDGEVLDGYDETEPGVRDTRTREWCITPRHGPLVQAVFAAAPE